MLSTAVLLGSGLTASPQASLATSSAARQQHGTRLHEVGAARAGEGRQGLPGQGCNAGSRDVCHQGQASCTVGCLAVGQQLAVLCPLGPLLYAQQQACTRPGGSCKLGERPWKVVWSSGDASLQPTCQNVLARSSLDRRHGCAWCMQQLCDSDLALQIPEEGLEAALLCQRSDVGMHAGHAKRLRQARLSLARAAPLRPGSAAARKRTYSRVVSARSATGSPLAAGPEGAWPLLEASAAGKSSDAEDVL